MADGETACIFVLFRPPRAVFQHAGFSLSRHLGAAAVSYADTNGFATRRRVGVRHLRVATVCAHANYVASLPTFASVSGSLHLRDARVSR